MRTFSDPGLPISKSGKVTELLLFRPRLPERLQLCSRIPFVCTKPSCSQRARPPSEISRAGLGGEVTMKSAAVKVRPDDKIRLSQIDLTLLASISSRFSSVCLGVSETLGQLRYEQRGLSAPVRKRTQRVGGVPCVPYAAASRANTPCIFYKQNHRRDQRRQRPVPLQFLLARDQVPYAMGI